MSSAALFLPSDNARIDLSAPPLPTQRRVLPTVPFSAAFLDSYLAHRSAPRRRSSARAPYATLDVLVAASLLAPESPLTLGPAHLLDVLLLFPAGPAAKLLRGREIDLVSVLAGLREAVDSGEEDVADGVDVLLCAVRAGAGAAVMEAFSAGGRQSGVADGIRSWIASGCLRSEDDRSFVDCALLEIEEMIHQNGTDPGKSTETSHLIASGKDQVLLEIEKLVCEMMPNAAIEDVRTALAHSGNNADAAVGLLLEASATSEMKAVGKRTERRRHIQDLTGADRSTFSGAAAEADGGYSWLQKRIDAELARQATIDPDDPRERVGAYTFLVGGLDHAGAAGGMYDDEPDDAVLAGEEPLARPKVSKSRYVTGSVGSTSELSISVPMSTSTGAAGSWRQNLATDKTDDDNGSSTDEFSSGDEGDMVAGLTSQPISARWTHGGSMSSRGGFRGGGSDGQARGGGESRGKSSNGSGGGPSHGEAVGTNGPGGGDGRGRGRGRGRGTRGGARGAHGRRDCAAKKQARAGF
jgi:hypothetical protein